jgi:hypothetical protein
MPRSGGGIYSKPAGTTAVPNTVIESSKYNSTIDDIVTDLNAARPISAGGTGSTTAADARTALGISATNTPFTPTGAIAATNVQTALAELDTEKAALLGATFTGGISGTTAAFSGAVSGTTGTFSGVVTGANASADTHLLNRITADGRYQATIIVAWTDIASAATMDVGAVNSENLRVTGTTTVTSLGTAASGVTRTLRAASGFTLTHGANIVCPASTSLVLAADDYIRVSSLGGGVWHVTDTRLGADRSAIDGALGFRLRAAANFSGVALTGTYSRTGTLVTVTMTAHGMATGQVVNLDFTTGTATDGTYTVTVTGVNEFTVVDAASGSTSGNVTRQIFIRSSLNISSITDNGIGDYTLNFTSAMPDANFVFQMTASDNGTGTGGPAQSNGFAYGSWVRGPNSTGYATGSMRFQIGYPATADLYDQTHINVAIFR